MSSQKPLFQKAPLLYFSLLFLSGIFFKLSQTPFAAIFGLFLALLTPGLKKHLYFLPLGYFFTLFFTPATTLFEQPSNPIHFTITKIRKASVYKSGYIYYGYIKSFKNLQASVFVKEENRPPANCDYLIDAQLKTVYKRVRIIPQAPWQRVPRSFSLAETRFLCKKKLTGYLRKHLLHQDAYHFFQALITGESQDPYLRYHFGKVGLQHILAVSGFHFGIVLFFCGLLFKGRKIKEPFLLVSGLCYFLFIGPSPPVNRAFVMAALFLASRLLGRKSNAANTLGGAMLLELALDPQAALQISFQLSFAACFAIIFIYPGISRLFLPFLPSRKLREVIRLPIFARLQALVLLPLRSAFLLTLAINLVLWPLLFYHFQTLPLISFMYNLFFPLLCVSACFLLVFAAIAPFLFALSSYYTNFILKLIIKAPPLWQFCLYAKPPPALLIASYLLVLFLAMSALQRRELTFNSP